MDKKKVVLCTKKKKPLLSECGDRNFTSCEHVSSTGLDFFAWAYTHIYKPYCRQSMGQCFFFFFFMFLSYVLLPLFLMFVGNVSPWSHWD